MGKYNNNKRENSKPTKKQNFKNLTAEIIALLAIIVLIVALTLVGANGVKVETSLFALDRDTYVLDGDYTISDLDFDAIGSIENNLRLNHACCIDLNGYTLDLSGFVLSIYPSNSNCVISIKNGVIKNGSLIIDADDNDLLIDGVTFDRDLKYSLKTADSNFSIKSSTVSSKNIQAVGGTLLLENSKIGDIDLVSNLIATGSTIGKISTSADNLTLNVNSCTIENIKVNDSTTLEGTFDCNIDIESNATASADTNKKAKIIIKNKVSTINVNTAAVVELPRDGNNGATVGTMNVNAENANINIMNCSQVDSLNIRAKGEINIAGKVGEMYVINNSNISTTESSIIENMIVEQTAKAVFIDIEGTVHYSKIYGDGKVTYGLNAYILNVDIGKANQSSDDTLSNGLSVDLECQGAVVNVYKKSEVTVMRDCKIELIIDYTDTAANIKYLLDENQTALDDDDVDPIEIKTAIDTFEIPIDYIDTTCLGDGKITFAPGANRNSPKVREKNMKSTGHKFEYTIDKPATENEEGIGRSTCTVCGVTQTYSIPKEKYMYSPNSIVDYIGLLFNAGEYDYSLQDNSGYILNHSDEEGGTSSEEGDAKLYNILFFKKCYIHFSIEKDRSMKSTRIFGDIDIDATVLTGYSGDPDFSTIDESKAESVVNYKFTAAIKDSVIAFVYAGPQFLFLPESNGEFGTVIDITKEIDSAFAMIPYIPEGFGINDLIDIIETVRKVVYYWERYKAPFEFIWKAFIQNIDISSIVPGLSWIAKAEEDNTFYLSFEHLANALEQLEEVTLSDYLDGIFGRRVINTIFTSAYDLPDMSLAAIDDSIHKIAGLIGGVSEQSIYDDINIMLSMLIRDTVDKLPGDSDAIKEKIRLYFGRDFDLKNAIAEYGSYTIYELLYGEYDPNASEEEIQAYQEQHNNFNNSWDDVINTFDKVVMQSQIGSIIDGALESFDAFTSITTFKALLSKLTELDKYFSYVWKEDDNGNRLWTDFSFNIPENIEYVALETSMNFSSYMSRWIANIKEGLWSSFFPEDFDDEEEYEEEYEEGEGYELGELYEVFSFRYDNKYNYFENFDFSMILFKDGLELPMFALPPIKVDLYTTGDVDKDEFNQSYNNYSFRISALEYVESEDDEDDVEMNEDSGTEEFKEIFEVDYCAMKHRITHFASNIYISDELCFIYNHYKDPQNYIKGRLAVPFYESSIDLLLEYKSDASDGPFVIREDATPTDVIKDALNMFESILVNVSTMGIENFIQLKFDPELRNDNNQQFVRVFSPVEISDALEYCLVFDEDTFDAVGYVTNGGKTTIRRQYGIVNDEFFKKDGKITGLKLTCYESKVGKNGDEYKFNGKYELIGFELNFDTEIYFKYLDYNTIITKASKDNLNNDYYDDDETIILDNGDIYVYSHELNRAYEPDEQWRMNWANIGNANDNKALALQYDHIVEGGIDYTYSDNHDIGAWFTSQFVDNAHYTKVMSGGNYETKLYEAVGTDVEGNLVISIDRIEPQTTDERVNYKLNTSELYYMRHREVYNKTGEIAYMNWQIDKTGNYSFIQYDYEGGSVIYDAEKDEFSGELIEHKHTGYHYVEDKYYVNDYVERVKYVILDTKEDGHRCVSLVRYRYDDDNENYLRRIGIETYCSIDVLFGEDEDTFVLEFGSEWLAKVERLIHKMGIINSHRTTSEIRETGATEKYQIILYKNAKENYYNGVSLRLYDFEVSLIIDEDQIKLKFDIRRFGENVNLDIFINMNDYTDSHCIILANSFNVNISSDAEELNGYIAVSNIKYLTLYRDNITGEFDCKAFIPYVFGINFGEGNPYYLFSFIYKDEDVDLLWGVHGREQDTWFEQVFGVVEGRDIVKLNYDRNEKILKVDLTAVQLGPIRLCLNIMLSDSLYEFGFSLVGVLEDDYQYETAGKDSIMINKFVEVKGNRQTGAINIFTSISLIESDLPLAIRFMKDPNGDNGFGIYKWDDDYAMKYSDDWDGMEYIAFFYNLADYTCRIIMENEIEAVIEIDEEDPTTRNIDLWIGIIELERHFQVVELEDGRYMAVSNIWDNIERRFDPSIFIITLIESETESVKQVSARIDRGLGAEAKWVGQLDYTKDSIQTLVSFYIMTQLTIRSEIKSFSQVNGNGYREYFLNIPFNYNGDGYEYDCSINFKTSNDPSSNILNPGTEDEMTVEEFIDQFIESLTKSLYGDYDEDEGFEEEK